MSDAGEQGIMCPEKTNRLRNVVPALIVLIAIVLLHFSGVLSLLLLVGVLYGVPAVGMAIQYRYLTGDVFTRVLWCMFPWLLFSVVGLLLSVMPIEAVSNEMAHEYFYAPLYGVVVGVLLILIGVGFRLLRKRIKS